MRDSHQLSRLEEVIKLIRQLPERKLSQEIEIGEALGRIVGHDLYAPEDLPHFSRSMIDGYAISVLDAVGLADGKPATFSITSEIRAGEIARTPLTPRSAVRVVVGGMLPPGADAVVMHEQIEVKGNQIEVYPPVSAGQNMIPVASDLRAGSLVLPKGHLLRPQDVGILAALGFDRLYAVRKPKVGILSTGDELVEITEDLKPGRVRDLNTYTLSSLVQCNYGIPVAGGIIPDDRFKIQEALERSLAENDLVMVSGASSLKIREYLIDILSQMGQIHCYALAMRPGRLTLIAQVGDKMVFGLPGYPVSAMIIFELLVKPYLDVLTSHKPGLPFYLQARMKCNVASSVGYDEFFRVKLEFVDGVYWAHPISGEYALISTLVQADGLVHIPYDQDGLKAGDPVFVQGFSGGC